MTFQILTNMPATFPLPKGVRESKIAYGRDLSTDPMTWEPKVIDPWLEANVPADYNGYLCLDWETGAYQQLIQYNPPHPDLDSLIELYVGLIKHIKQARPRVEVGYYMLPVGGNSSLIDLIYAHARRLQPIFDAADVLFPSHYIPGQYPFQQWQAGVSMWLPMVLEVAKDQPVFPYTWHRYGHVDKANGFRLVPPDIHTKAIEHLRSIKYRGKKIDGIVTWGDDQWWYGNAINRRPDGTWNLEGPKWENVRAAFLEEIDIRTYVENLQWSIYARLSESKK